MRDGGPGLVDGTSILFPFAAGAGRRIAARLRGRRPTFICVVASTDTALVPGISAAGASPELIPYTAAADAEVLAYGAARCIRGVPCNPAGPPGPAIIAREALELADIPRLVVSAGCHVLPDAPYVALGSEPGAHIGTGRAVPHARDLFDAGRALGRAQAAQSDYLVLAESVPGGTTTALALLLALGIAADGRVSSSLAGNPHALKSRIAHEALTHLDPEAARADPLAAVATLGDPMQAAVAGLTAGAADAGAPVLLAGGTQMIAIAALVERLASVGVAPRPHMVVATTRWVAEDTTADPVGLMREAGNYPLLATALTFAASPFPALRLYESGLVKEGVGAGGAAVAASLASNISSDRLRQQVEERYAAMLGESGSAPLGTEITPSAIR